MPPHRIVGDASSCNCFNQRATASVEGEAPLALPMEGATRAPVMLNRLQTLKGKEVEVDFHGSLYKGILTDVSEDEIFLKSGDHWLSLPLYEVGDIRPIGGS